MKAKSFLCYLIYIVFLISCDSSNEIDVPETKEVIHDGDIVLRSQADVEKIREKNITHITGNLKIGPTVFEGPTDINDLSSLSNLTIVDGFLSLNYNSDLTHLADIKNLREVGGLSIISMFGLTNLDDLAELRSVRELYLENNSNLVSLSGIAQITIAEAFRLIKHEKLAILPEFQNITNLVGLYIDGNPMLSDLSAFKNLRAIEKNFYIRCAPNTLTSLNFSNLKSVGNWFRIEFQNDGDNKLTSLQSFSNLKSIGNEIILINLDGLLSLQGLHNIESIKGIKLEDLDVLEEIDAFEKVTAVSGINVLRNEKLQNLGGLSSISQGAADKVSVKFLDNPLLSHFCDIKAVVSLPNCEIEISGNGQNPTIQEIKDCE